MGGPVVQIAAAAVSQDVTELLGMEVKMLTLELPYPPTVNLYWRRAGRNIYVSEAGKAFRANVEAICWQQQVKPLAGPLAIDIRIYPPDLRRRDIDNGLKALLDALEKAGAYHNDNQITRLTIERCEPVAGGQTFVQLESFSKDGSI